VNGSCLVVQNEAAATQPARSPIAAHARRRRSRQEGCYKSARPRTGARKHVPAHGPLLIMRRPMACLRTARRRRVELRAGLAHLQDGCGSRPGRHAGVLPATGHRVRPAQPRAMQLLPRARRAGHSAQACEQLGHRDGVSPIPFGDESPQRGCHVRRDVERWNSSAGVTVRWNDPLTWLVMPILHERLRGAASLF
jgi:hypothetical protein